MYLSVHLFGSAAPAGPAGSFFATIYFFLSRSKSCFDVRFVIYAKFRVDLYLGFIQRCFLRRVMAEQRSNLNFGPNVRDYVLGGKVLCAIKDT